MPHLGENRAGGGAVGQPADNDAATFASSTGTGKAGYINQR